MLDPAIEFALLKDFDSIKSVFEHMDKDGSGKVTREEFLEEVYGIADDSEFDQVYIDRANAIFDKIDHDHDGTVDVLELAKYF